MKRIESDMLIGRQVKYQSDSGDGSITIVVVGNMKNEMILAESVLEGKVTREFVGEVMRHLEEQGVKYIGRLV